MTDRGMTDPGTQPASSEALGIDTPVVLSRTVELEVSTDELWTMVADGDRWGDWLAEQSDVVVEPDGSGTVVDDDGIERSVAIHSVVPGERVRFAWWPTDRPGESSVVELVVLPAGDGDGHGSRLSITEIYATGANSTSTRTMSASAATTGTALSAWDLRLMRLVLCLQSVALVRT